MQTTPPPYAAFKHLRFVLTVTAGLFANMMAANMALACSCVNSSLQEKYDAADRIFVGQAAECIEGTLTADGSCPTGRWRLSVIEALKGSGDSPVLTERSSCPLWLQIGKNYLIFMNKGGGPSICNGSLALREPPDSRANERLRQLRDYRDGKTENLYPPWVFQEVESTCTLGHTFGNTSLRFAYSTRATQPPENGMIEKFVVKTPLPDHITGEGMQKTVNFSATFMNHQDIVPASTRIKVGDRRWSFETMEVELKLRGSERPLTIHNEFLTGSQALDVLQALTQHDEFTLRAERKKNQRATIGFAPKPLSPNPPAKPMALTSYTIRLQESAEQFLDCVDRVSALEREAVSTP